VKLTRDGHADEDLSSMIPATSIIVQNSKVQSDS
jgi:hypothetical protein